MPLQSYCPFCRDLGERFDDADCVPGVKTVHLDGYDNGNAIRDQLKAETGQPHVPYVYVAGKHHDSAAVLAGLKSPGSLKTTLTAAGVAVKGYFRP